MCAHVGAVLADLLPIAHHLAEPYAVQPSGPELHRRRGDRHDIVQVVADIDPLALGIVVLPDGQPRIEHFGKAIADQHSG